MSPISIDIDAPRALRIAEDYEQVGERVQDLIEPFKDVALLLEETHARHFRRLKGRYVRTGATRTSLTTSGTGAIRDADRVGLVFGSSIWYSHFLTKAPKDPNSGQVKKEPPGKGKSAVLVFSRTTQKKVANILMGYIVEPFG